MPTEENKYMKFTATEKQIPVRYVFYADFECLLTPMDDLHSWVNQPDHSFTESYAQHEPCGYCLYLVSSDPEEVFDFENPLVVRGTEEGVPKYYPDGNPVVKKGEQIYESVVSSFIQALQRRAKVLDTLIKEDVGMVITPEQESEHAQATVCYLCKEPLGANPQNRHRDHDHGTGEFRGSACAKCNLGEGRENTKDYHIPVFFHNLKGYDGHHILTEAGRFTSKITAIPLNFEKMLSFSFKKLRFLDTQSFLLASLDTLAANLYEDGKGLPQFKHTAKNFPIESQLLLVVKKGIYPYEYMNSWGRFTEEELPPKEAFFSRLTDSEITDEDYAHALAVWTAFGCETLGDYHDLYVKTDVLLLADVFETHRSNTLKHYELDCAHYYTTPNFAWDAMLKKTGVTLELLTEYNMLLLAESGLRGGISMISHRHGEANNTHMGEQYDPDKESAHLMYLDANNLYGNEMVKGLPIGNFRWSEERDLATLIRLYTSVATPANQAGPDDTEGCIVKVDLHYPPELHDYHNDYPLAPERKLVTDEMLSPFAKAMKDRLGIGSDKLPKLVPNLQDKVGYTCDIRALKFYLDQGLKVTKVHAVLTFTQSCWMEPYIMFNTHQRAQAKNEFQKDFFKLMSNACFGKTMENLRGRSEMEFICDNKQVWGKHTTTSHKVIARKIASPLHAGHMIYNEHLAVIKKHKKEILFNKPIAVGMSILDLSKIHMYDYHYNTIKAKYGEKAKLLFTDTDSLCYEVKCEDFYQFMWDTKDDYDLSNFPEKESEPTAKFFDKTNKKVLGKFKDECGGKVMTEFVGLRPKMYSCQIGTEEKQTAKGIQKGFVRKHITHADYKRCLTSDQRSDQQQYASFSKFNTRRQQVTTDQINKVGLCAFDNKRFMLDDGVSSLAYGHHRIAHPEELETDEIQPEVPAPHLS
jgi:hypothetical protein